MIDMLCMIRMCGQSCWFYTYFFLKHYLITMYSSLFLEICLNVLVGRGLKHLPDDLALCMDFKSADCG